ncbi:MAG: glucose 1-dehydrogenase [Novosphingobium sp.]|jgi:3(or 17)beta-hydroxysteroid dehydrogenase|nr:glucose 1-dehydrogenase [Novosphingobium sp.]
MRLAEKQILVTGAASGLGAAMARRFVAEGAAVVIADIAVEDGEALAAELGPRARFARLDVTREAGWQEVLAGCQRLDVLVNNAGITTLGSVEDITLDQFRHEFDVDVVGVFLGCKYVIPLMKERGGSLINIASMCGVRAQPDLFAYNAAKAAVIHMTRSVALHCASRRYGIRCNAILPGMIETPIQEKVLSQSGNRDAVYAAWVAGHPIGRLGRPEEIAAMAVYLASDEAAFTTGAEFRVDGGSSL